MTSDKQEGTALRRLDATQSGGGEGASVPDSGAVGSARDDVEALKYAVDYFSAGMFKAEAEIASLKEVLTKAGNALLDMHAGWRYIRQYHGDLDGVGWDRCEQSASSAENLIRAALTAPSQPSTAPSQSSDAHTRISATHNQNGDGE